MDFRILGALEVVSEGDPLRLGGGKQRALLALLLLHPNETVSVDRLVDDLWGERPPPTAAKNVQVYVSHLRKALGDDVIVTTPPGYAVRVAEGELDADRAAQALAAAAGRPAPSAGSTSRPRSPSGAAPHWPTSRTSHLRRARSGGSRSSACSS